MENSVIINEKNGGIYDIDNPLGSFCGTEINTTKDSEGNLIVYDEIAFTNIIRNRNNSYIKKKIIKLIDKTNLSELNLGKFNETLKNLYPNKQRNIMKNFPKKIIMIYIM